MLTLPSSSERSSRTGAAAMVSVLVHLTVIALLLRTPSVARLLDDSHILPALYLYAHDRRPSEPRETRLPIPEPPGNAGRYTAPVSLQPADHGDRPQALRLPGLVPMGRTTTTIDSVFSVLSVDSEVTRIEGSAAPVYPSTLIADGIEGFVVAEFVVDTSGLVDAGSIQIVRSSHKEFSASVRLALLGMEFRPAWRGSRKVRQLVTQRFTFHLQPPDPATTL